MSAFLPCVRTLTIESCECDAMKSALNVAILGNFSFIVLGGVPITPWHLRQFSLYSALPSGAWAGCTDAAATVVGTRLRINNPVFMVSPEASWVPGRCRRIGVASSRRGDRGAKPGIARSPRSPDG